MKYYRCIEDDKIYTEQDLLELYKTEYTYDLEYKDVPFSKWLGNCMTRNNGSLEEVFPFHVEFWVECFDRWLIVDGFSVMTEEQIWEAMDDRYGQWHNPEEYPDAECACCEEWILQGLDEIGIVYNPTYLD